MSKQRVGPTFRYRHNQVYLNDRPRCPVCNQAVYSRNGIHPQCAAEQGDKEAMQALKAEVAAKEVQPPGKDAGPPKRPVYGRGWQRAAAPKDQHTA